MKPSLAHIAAAAGLAALLAGCGQPGPLYMPKPPAKPAKPATTPAPATTGQEAPVTPPASTQQ